MPTLFISHASEDKERFVRPLAAALKAEFEVWYDEYVLKVGDSLRAKIDEGLRACDFGVVVLSDAFFRKKWTQAELDGLLALEEVNKKLILPIWLGVGEDDVKKFSPILAGRLAAAGDKGVEHVVDQLRWAINASSRTHEVEMRSRSEIALRGLTDRLDAEEAESGFLQSSPGVSAVAASARRIAEIIATSLRGANERSRKARFQVEVQDRDRLVVYGPNWLCMVIGMQDFFMNNAERTAFAVRITQGGPELRRFEEGQTRWEQQWVVRAVDASTITWADDRTTAIRDSADAIADQIIERFVGIVHGESNVGW